MDKDSFIDKVLIVAEFKYALDEEVVLSFTDEIDFCWDNNFGPVRTVEFIAEKIF
jgi:hypothetical protein